MKPSRRCFLASTTLLPLVTAATEDQTVVVDFQSEAGVVRPELHGHFAEHLGTCIYGGLWVGKNSPVRNLNGYHAAAVQYLKELGIPVLRWPGGCFADDYHWRDGIGPVEKRPKRVNIWWGYYTEDNSFGTHEFIGLCRLIGAQPYFAGNVGSGTPQELRDWVEYCNYPSGSTLSDERAANGSPDPFRVKYWGVGNENWGCGGSMTAEEYAAQYRRFSNYISGRAGVFQSDPMYLVACGPSSHDLKWTRGFFDTLGARRRPNGYAMHFYSRGSQPATKFNVEAMREQLSSFSRMETAIVEQRALMDKYDPQKRIDLLIDEWGVWDRILPEEEKRYGKLFQNITMRSAVAAAMGLNVFHRQAAHLSMCNIAQVVNVLHSLLLIDGGKCVRTTTYWAFDLLKAHRGKTSLKTNVANQSALGLSVSASRKDGSAAVTLVNPRHDTTMRVRCALSGATAKQAQARILQQDDYNAANDWDQPDRITPRTLPVEIAGNDLKLTLPPLSVATILAGV